MSQLVQITRHEGRIDRVKRGRTPIIELHLEPHQYVVSAELKEIDRYDLDRKTVDWRWSAYVATPCGRPA